MIDKLFNLFSFVVLIGCIVFGISLIGVIWSSIKGYFEKNNQKDIDNKNYGGLLKYNRIKTFCYIVINEINERRNLLKRGLNSYEDLERIKRFKESVIYFADVEKITKYFSEEEIKGGELDNEWYFVQNNIKEMKLFHKELLDDKTYERLEIPYHSIVKVCNSKIEYIEECIRKNKKYTHR